MKKPALAWAIKSGNEYICVCWTKKEAKELAHFDESVVRVEIKEVVRKR